MGANSKKVILVCETCLSRNYSVTKSAVGQHERIVIKKHCRKCNGHTVHKETR